MRWIYRSLLGLLVVFALLWAILAIPLFSDLRRTVVSQRLSAAIGQPLLIEGDVKVVIGRVGRVHASRVRIPSENIAGIDVAQLERLDFDLDLIALLRGKVDLDNLFIDGLTVELRTLDDGTRSWNARPADQDEPDPDNTEDAPPARPPFPMQIHEAVPDALDFLQAATVSLTRIRLIYENALTGFEYDFELEELAFDQLADGKTLQVTSRGSVNDRPFELDGKYPRDAPFTTMARFSSVAVVFDGDPLPEARGEGFSGVLNVDVEDLGDLLDVLKLDRSLEGVANLQTTVTMSSAGTSLTNLSASFEFDDGQTVAANGRIEDLATLAGTDMRLDARLYPENDPPAPAGDLKDIRLTEIAAHILSDEQGFRFEELLFKTNAFETALGEVGPVSVGRVRRTEDGRLAANDILLNAGPRAAPILVARGNIRNVLELKDLDFQGRLDVPASFVLGSLGEEADAAFGSVQAEFAIDDAQGFLSVTNLTAQAVNTDVWAMDARFVIGEVTTLDGLELDLALDIRDGAEFLSELKLKPVNTGRLGIGASVRVKGQDWTAQLGLGAGTSQVKSTFRSGEADGRPAVHADIFSESLAIADLRNAIAGAVEVGKIGKENPRDEASAQVELQPLVLPKDEAFTETGPALVRDGVELQPLVLPRDTTDELFDLNEFLRETDLLARIDFKRLSGIQGVTRVSSELVSQGGKARFGPLEVNYGSGFFRVQARMDVIEAPSWLSVSGSTSGLDFSRILQDLGVNLDARGALNGTFSVGGNVTSARAFLSTITGKATVRLANGQVTTSLLELAGLGIFPWIFSKERRQGYTDIVCLNAPARLSAGVISVDPAVVETRSVQLIARGTVDLKNESIAMRAEPRPVGRPLARSAWPVDISGPLAAPDFKLDVGGSRNRRADGADQMPENRTPCQPDIYQLEQRGG